MVRAAAFAPEPVAGPDERRSAEEREVERGGPLGIDERVDRDDSVVHNGEADDRDGVPVDRDDGASGMSWEQFQESLAGRTHARRRSTLAEMANVAVFIASDRASGMTGTTVNLSLGSLDD